GWRDWRGARSGIMRKAASATWPTWCRNTANPRTWHRSGARNRKPNVGGRRPGGPVRPICCTIHNTLLVFRKSHYLRAPLVGNRSINTPRTVASTTHTTSMANAATTQKEWLLVDAENEVLGRIASQIPMLARGKHQPPF